MLKDLPAGLIQTSSLVAPPLEDCPTCGAVVGNCIHTDGDIVEDTLGGMDLTASDESSKEIAQLSGDKEEVIVNPEYQMTTAGFKGRPR